MEALRCPNCGGTMEQIAVGRYKCNFCKKESVIKNDSNELVFALNTAARYRAKKDFDSAMEEYERAIGIDPTCSDAYWGMFLSEYGIEFVKDPQSGEYKPTVCHRIQTTPVANNFNFKKALELAVSDGRDSLIAMSKQIDVVREQLLSMSGHMPDYDIFICYKQNEDDSKTPTKESVWARDMYYQLIGNGYKVFYAEQSLADKEGEYEANIYSALNSARVMLILASSLEHVNATWVKNEWSRFVKLAKENQSKSFKVILSGFEPELLPVALRSQQVIRKGDIDWWDKVRLYIDNVFSKDSTKARDIDDKAKKRLADFNAMREKAVKARQNTQETLSAKDVLDNKRKNDALASVKNEIAQCKNHFDEYVKNVAEWKDCIREFCAKDYECAKLYFVLECSVAVNNIITDEASLVDYALKLSDLKGIGYVYKVCNDDERNYYQQIQSICEDNFNAHNELEAVWALLKEKMYDEALGFAQNIAQEHPTYQEGWLAVLCAKNHCETVTALAEKRADSLIATDEYKNIINGLSDKKSSVLTDEIAQVLQEKIDDEVKIREQRLTDMREREYTVKKKDKQICEERKEIKINDIFFIILCCPLVLTAIGAILYTIYDGIPYYSSNYNRHADTAGLILVIIGPVLYFIWSIVLGVFWMDPFDLFSFVLSFVPIANVVTYIYVRSGCKTQIKQAQRAIEMAEFDYNKLDGIVRTIDKGIDQIKKRRKKVVNYDTI